MAGNRGQSDRGGESQSPRTIQDTIIKLIDEKSDKLEPWLIAGFITWLAAKVISYQPFKEWCRRNVPTYLEFTGEVVEQIRDDHGPISRFFRLQVIPRLERMNQRLDTAYQQHHAARQAYWRRNVFVRLFQSLVLMRPAP